jgi:hypothetical protein
MARDATVLKVTGPVVLDWGNGIRLQISPAGAVGPGLPGAPAKPKGRAGRKPSPATVALQAAMAEDAQTGRQRSRSAYIQVLKEHGHKASAASASVIVSREAKRAFGKPLGRGRKGRRGKAGRGGGRVASPATAHLREKIGDDKAKGDLRDTGHYVRWLVDKAGIGLKKARPIVYRELRQAKSS